MTTRVSRVTTAALVGLGLAAAPGSAQLINVKTIPVAESEQFSFFPTAGRGGISFVLADSLLDPFGNPAKAALVQRSQYFGAPSFFAVSNNAGGGTTFPMGGLWKRGSTFAGLAAAYQQIDRAQEPFTQGFGFTGPIIAGSSSLAPGFQDETPQTARNQYVLALLGQTFDSSRTSIAARVLWSGLSSVDGVDNFYNGNQSLTQLGDAVDMRIGMTRALSGGRSLELLILRNRFALSHDVGFVDFFWEPALRQNVPRIRRESNSDRSSVWGMHVEYEQPIDSTWRFGALVTTNLIEHPRIPTYEITAGLGNRGSARAYNIGGGVGRSLKNTAFGVDAIYEPIDSRSFIPDTIDNRFHFKNAKLRGGISHDFSMLTPGNFIRLQFAGEYHWINYVLRQHDQLNDIRRRSDEHWLERGRSGGLSFITPTLQMHYIVATRTGVGRPGVVSDRVIGGPSIDVLSAPWRPDITPQGLGAVSVTRHQFSISVPVR